MRLSYSVPTNYFKSLLWLNWELTLKEVLGKKAGEFLIKLPSDYKLI